MNKVTRFEVIDHTENGTGRIISVQNVQVELSYQDDGQTLKVFLNDRKDNESNEPSCN